MNLYSRLFVILGLCLCNSAVAWDGHRETVAMVVDGRTIPYQTFAIYLMPGQQFELRFEGSGNDGEVLWHGKTTRLGESQLVAPETPGLYPMQVTPDFEAQARQLNVFVMTPASKVNADKRLNGYRIGSYPETPYKGLDVYKPPVGFVEVTAENRNTKVSPNFVLGQFVSKQHQGYPKYVVLKANLLLKLENILGSLNRSGHKVDGLTIMSGYRTPFYNRAIGNVPNSRHVFGGAADFYIDDKPQDGRMDDLNADGRVDRADAQWLAAYIKAMSQRGEFGKRIGGIGIYGSNSAHGPFVHVDVRGSLARW